MAPKVYLTDNGREIVTDICAAIEKLPLERKYYLLGIAQGMASSNNLEAAHGKTK